MRMILIGAVILTGLGTTLYQVKSGIDARQDRLNDLTLTIAATTAWPRASKSGIRIFA